MKTLAGDAATRDDLQAAVDWMFLMTLEWFGLPDELKRHREQIDYGLKGKTNDELRQEWMSTAVPFCESIGIGVPAHHEPAKGEYVIDCPFPQQFDEQEKRWLTEEGEISVGSRAGALAPSGPRERGARRDDPARTAQRMAVAA